VKNVGTPYTVYLGRGLYSTYMEAYTLVDGNVRRAMEGMLKTWKEPVPGSMDKRPVFPPEVVRPIENALIKAKTAALQHQRLPPAGYKNTPTPPQMNGQFGLPQGQYAHQQYQRQQHTPQPGQFQPPYQSTPAQQGGYPYAQPPQQPPHNDVEAIKRDLIGVINQTQRDFASDPSSSKIQQKLKALLELQQVLNVQQLPPQSLQAVAAQIAQLAVPATPQPNATPTVGPTPQWSPPVQAPQFPFQPPHPPFAQPPSAPPPFMQQQPPMPAFNPQQLGSLAALFQNNQKPSTPQIREAVPSLEKAPHAQLHSIQNQPAAAPTPQFGNDLIASLTKAGLMKPPSATPVGSTPLPPLPAAVPPPTDLMAMLSTLHKRNPSQNTGGMIPQMPIASSGKPTVPITNAALKTFRPELLRALYSDQPNQCSTCGRRFLSTPEGRANKARHLDWHFRINQRLAEFSASRAAAHRHWFPDAREWMQLEDFDASTASAADGDGAPGSGGKAGTSAASKPKGPEDMWIRAPAGVTKLNCPICYEDMRSSHPEELQDWVFMNAVYNNGRAVHATCLQEMTGSVPGLQQAQQQKQAPAPAPVPVQIPSSLQAALASLSQGTMGMREGSRTPDSMLGKRKAEGDVMGSAEKMRKGGW
jgi:pre-mRNA cleavage complex 2 protein Pcf11